MRASALALPFAALLAPLLASLAMGCATYQDDLTRGERAFEASEHARALAIFRGLEGDTGRLSSSEQAHYAYLRGMTDLRIGYKAEARHWLSIAAADEQRTPGSLPSEWATRLGQALKDLNEEVFTAGVESLANAAAPAKTKADEGGDSESGDSETTPKKPAAKPAKSED
jgi:hypothetical protein